MSKKSRDKNHDTHQFHVVIHHPEIGPTLEQLHDTLHDWFHDLLLTGKYKKSGEASSNEIPSQVDPDRQE